MGFDTSSFQAELRRKARLDMQCCSGRQQREASSDVNVYIKCFSANAEVPIIIETRQKTSTRVHQLFYISNVTILVISLVKLSIITGGRMTCDSR